ncbi:MAG TPA: IS1634 family transposase [Desulfatiglandales bacterium]|nr:IS1634 family transposase [Desulfatiglandales bacterium]
MVTIILYMDIRKIKPYLEKKIVKGNTYYQLVRKTRIDGKVKRVWSKYLGTPETIEKVYDMYEEETSLQLTSFEYGRTSALIKISEELGFIDIVNKHTTKKNIEGLTVGEYLLLIILGRASGPISKSKTSEWFQDSFLDIIWSFPHKLNTNNFTNHMDYITDDVMRKIEDDIGKKLVEQGIKPSTLFFDTTNFFTYIEHGEDIPKKSRSKEKRYDKNLVGLGLTVSDGNIPFFHETYPGNIQDSKVFGMIFDKIVERLNSIDVPHEDIVLVFDKGCNSKINIDKVISKMHIVGSVKKNQAEELYDVPLDEFDLLYETKKKHTVLGYRTKKEVFGTEFTIVVRYHSGSYRKQKQTYEKKKVVILKKLNEIKQSVERVGKGRKKSITNALIDASKVVPDDYKEVFPFEGFEKENVFMFSFEEKAEKKLVLTFGKTILFTDKHDWDTEKIVKTYNQRDFVEKDFMWMKGLMIISMKPFFLRKDKRIKVHSFLCVMGLVFYRLLLWILKKQEEVLSETRVIEELEKIRVALVKKGDGKPQFEFETMSLDQMRLFTALGLETVLKEI